VESTAEQAALAETLDGAPVEGSTRCALRAARRGWGRRRRVEAREGGAGARTHAETACVAALDGRPDLTGVEGPHATDRRQHWIPPELVVVVVVELLVVVLLVGVVVEVVLVGGQLGQQFVLEPTVPPAPVHWAADCRTSHFPFFSVQVTAEAPWPQVEFAMQLRIAALHSLAKPLATMTLWMQSTYAEWLVNELQGHWLSNWTSKEHRTALQSTAPAGALGNSTNGGKERDEQRES
jgi:hypothetical protein